MGALEAGFAMRWVGLMRTLVSMVALVVVIGLLVVVADQC